MLGFAWKSLWRDRLRFALTAGGVSLAVLLMLTMNGLFASSGRQITTWIDHSGADLYVSQKGVTNMHMASSTLPESVVERVSQVAGVAVAEGITYFAATLEWDGESDTLYAMGIDPAGRMGGPWLMAEGTARPGPGEIVISDRQRSTNSPGLGDTVRVAGREYRVVGLAKEVKSLASTFVFMNKAETAALRSKGRVNYILVRLAPGADRAAVSAAVEAQVAGVTVLTRQAMSESDLRIALEMGVEILGLMAFVGFLIGLGVVALTIYAATVEQLRQYGVLKALGAGPGHLMAAMLGQGLAAAAAGFIGGVGLTAVVGWAVPFVRPGLEIDMPAAYVARIGLLMLLIGAGAALPPYLRVRRVDPVSVFRA